MIKIVNVLHLSDLHYTKVDASKAFELSQVKKALIKDLGTYCVEDRTPDLIIVSGDLVARASEKDIHTHVFDDFLDAICKAARCGEERLVLVPGNHDADRSIVEKREVELTELKSKQHDSHTLNSVFFDDRIAHHVSDVFAGFLELKEMIGDSTGDGISFVRNFPEIGVDVISLNTAWATWAGYKNRSDHGNLSVPEAAFCKSIESCDASFKILATHHPLSWLRDYRSTMEHVPHSIFWCFE